MAPAARLLAVLAAAAAVDGGVPASKEDVVVFCAVDVCLRWRQYLTYIRLTWGSEIRALGWQYRFFGFVAPSCVGGDGKGVNVERIQSEHGASLELLRWTPNLVMPWTGESVPISRGDLASKTSNLIRFGMEWGLRYTTATHVVTSDPDSFLCPRTIDCVLRRLPRARLVWARFDARGTPEKSFLAYSRDVAGDLVANASSPARLRVGDFVRARRASLHVVDDAARVAQEANWPGCWPLRRGRAPPATCAAFCDRAAHAHVKNLRSHDRSTGFYWLFSLVQNRTPSPATCQGVPAARGEGAPARALNRSRTDAQHA